MSDTVLDQLQALLETVRREAYERGYADAVERIMAAARRSGEMPLPPAMARPPAELTALDQPRRRRARRGSVEVRILEVLRRAPGGVSVPEIEDAMSDDPEPPKTPSIRFALKKLEGAGLVMHEGRRWRLLDESHAAEPADEQTASPADQKPEEELLAPEVEPATSIPGY